MKVLSSEFAISLSSHKCSFVAIDVVLDKMSRTLARNIIKFNVELWYKTQFASKYLVWSVLFILDDGCEKSLLVKVIVDLFIT